MNTKTQHTFPVILEADSEGGFVVTNPAFEGCYSQGETIEEALENIREATLLCLEAEEQGGQAVSSSRTPYVGVHFITA